MCVKTSVSCRCKGLPALSLLVFSVGKNNWHFDFCAEDKNFVVSRENIFSVRCLNTSTVFKITDKNDGCFLHSYFDCGWLHHRIVKEVSKQLGH